MFPNTFSFPPGHSVWLYSSASLVTRNGQVTEFCPMECGQGPWWPPPGWAWNKLVWNLPGHFSPHMPYTFPEQRGLRRGQSHTRARNLILWMTPRKATPVLWVLNMTKKYKDFSSHWKFSSSDTEARISFSQVPVGLSSLGVWKHDSKLGFPGGSVVKNTKNMPTNAGDAGSITVSGRSPGGENGNPLQYSCLGNPMDRGAWWATIHAVTEASLNLSISLTPLNHKRGLETHTHTHTHTQMAWMWRELEGRKI